MAIRWDEIPHERIRLQIYARLARNDVERSSEDSLRRILRRRLPLRDANDHRRYIEVEARSLIEHLRCTRDVYREFVDSQSCKPAIEAQWVVLRFAVFPTAVSILRQKIVEYSKLTIVRAADLSLLFGVPTRPCYKAVAEDFALISLPELNDKTTASDQEITSFGQLVDEDSLLIFKDVREQGGAIIRLVGGGPFSVDDARSLLNSFQMGAVQADITLPEWVKIRKELWQLGVPWTEGLCDLFMSVQEELIRRALPADSLLQELQLQNATSQFQRLVVPVRPRTSRRTLIATSRKSGSESETAEVSHSTAAEKLRPGRKPKLMEEFVLYAGRPWQDAISREEGTVTIGPLRDIAAALDQAGYLPPSAYLEGKFAKEIRLFNSRNSNSKNGPVRTWFGLVSRGDKDHIRGMRRLLSRCSRRLSDHSLSAN